MKIKVSNVNTPNWKVRECEIDTFLPNWRNCLNWHVTFGGHGIMKPPNSSEILNLPFGKKWDRTPYFCWSV